jgi:hypothetical protein
MHVYIKKKKGHSNMVLYYIILYYIILLEARKLIIKLITRKISTMFTIDGVL